MAAAAVRRRRPQSFGRQDPMRQPQFLRSNTFHWAFLVAAVFAVFIIVLFGFIYWKIDDSLTARSDRVITAERNGIADLPADPRPPGGAAARGPRGTPEAGSPRRTARGDLPRRRSPHHRQCGEPAARSAC